MRKAASAYEPKLRRGEICAYNLIFERLNSLDGNTFETGLTPTLMTDIWVDNHQLTNVEVAQYVFGTPYDDGRPPARCSTSSPTSSSTTSSWPLQATT